MQPDCEPIEFSTPRAALAHAQGCPVDVAFLDIEMPGMSGLSLAKRLKDAQPDMHIVFVTSYEHYALDAFALTRRATCSNRCRKASWSAS